MDDSVEIGGGVDAEGSTGVVDGESEVKGEEDTESDSTDEEADDMVV